MSNNDNTNDNILERMAGNNTNRRQKPPANTREQNIKKISQSQVELNRVKEALRNFATTSNNNNSQVNVTRSQVIKYHKLARDQLLKSNRDILTKIINLETTTHNLTLKDIKLSNNFFDAMPIAPPPGAPAGAPPEVVHGVKIRNAIHVTTGVATPFDPNSNLPDGWKTYYKLSKLVSTIRGNARFPWQGATPPGGPATHALQYFQAYHNNILGTLKDDKFSVKLSEQNGEFMIVIRYKAGPYHIDWTYTPSDTLVYALKFLSKLPKDFVKFSLDHISNLNSSNNNHGISASIVPMFTENQRIQIVRKAMEQASFPPRFWQMNVLKQKAQNNKVNNFSGNFLNTKQSRIESFLGKVDDLFTLISNGQQAHLSQAEIKKIIDSFAINPHIYTLEAQDKAIKKITKPLQQANNNRHILLTNPNYNNNDKRILSFPMGASLIGVVELLHPTYDFLDDIKFGMVGIRDEKNIDSGTTIHSLPIAGSSLPSITETKPQLEKYVKNEPFAPITQAQGNLYKAVTVIAHFCIWFGTAPRAGARAPFNNLRYWYDYYVNDRSGVVWAHQLRQYKQFTQNKIKYLISVLPKHFKLIPLLKEYCKSRDDSAAYSWFLSLAIL